MKFESRGENHCRELGAHYLPPFTFSQELQKTFSEFRSEIDELLLTLEKRTVFCKTKMNIYR